MLAIKEFEREVIEILVKDVLPSSVLASVIEEPEHVDYEYSGAGYFLTVKHAALPHKRIVCCEPDVRGVVEGMESGFIVFLENNELTLECHPWDDNLPEDYRDKEMSIIVVAGE